MASKIQLAQYSVHDFNDVSYVEPSSSRGQNMEQDEVIDYLNDQSFNKRVEILEQLILIVRRNGGRLPYTDQLSIFKGLKLTLSDSNWDVRLKCIQLINELIPQLDDQLDKCMSVVIDKLIPNIGDSKITVRKAVIQTLHVYMKNTTKVNALLRSIVHCGLENDEPHVRKETVVFLPMLFTPEFSRENFFDVAQSLAKKLLDTAVEDNLRDYALTTLTKLNNYVGDREFSSYLQKLSAPLRQYYYQLIGEPYEDHRNVSSHSQSTTSNKSTPFSKPDNGVILSSRTQETLEFGVVPSYIMKQLGDQENFRTRAQAIEELKVILSNLPSQAVSNKLMPNMLSFISFLNNMLDDSNFKITTVTLDILCILVEKLGQNVKHFLKPLASAIAKRMSDNKVVVRQAVMRVAMKMMQSYNAKPVLSEIFENLQHRNSRVRQEATNIAIAALLTFPSCDFDLPMICNTVGPLLTDPKRQVRQAALELFSVLAQNMGAGKLQPLVQAVDRVELTNEGEGLMAAVQSRLARRQLPKLNSEGLVEYATPVATSATHRTAATMQGADMEWIMASSSSTSRSSSDAMELESVTSSARSTPLDILTENSPTPAPRRYLSAGKGKKLPWEEEIQRDDRYKSYDKSYESSTYADHASPKSRNTWSTPDESHAETKRTPRRRIAGLGVADVDEPVQDTGSYKQIHLNRLKLQQQQQQQHHAHSPKKQIDVNDFSDRDTNLASPTNSEEAKSPVKESDESPIPLKPTLARSSARHHQRKVPPIPSSERIPVDYSIDDDTDSAYAPSLGSTLDNDSESHEEMLTSLRQIRNSASKKKEKVRLERESRSFSSRSPSPDNFHESGIYSSVPSSKNSADKYQFRNNVENPFESRPKLSVNAPRAKTNENEDGKNGPVRLDFSPHNGVTFRENRNSDVQIVGKGYNEDNYNSDKNSPVVNNRARDRRRVPKGSLTSPLGIASTQGYGAVDSDDELSPVPPDNIGVVGKGMFETGPPSDNPVSVGNIGSSDRGERRGSKPAAKNMPTGVIGVGMNRSESNDGLSSDSLDIDEETNNVDINKQLRDKIAVRQQQKQEEIEYRRSERQNSKEHEEKLLKERERQQEKLKRLNSSDSLTNSLNSLHINSIPNTPKNATVRQKPRKSPGSVTPSSHPTSASSHSVMESENPDDWTPFRDPESILRQAQKNLAQDGWEQKCTGINMIRRLAKFHPDVLCSQLHSVILALLNEVKNLRSQVSRLAIVALGELFYNLKRNMDADLDKVTKDLLAKSGETNGFIRDDVERSLSLMTMNVTPQRALLAVILGGATHKSPQVRKTAAQFLADIVARMGPGKILSGVKDITDRVLPTAAQLSMDQNPETRYYARKILFMLMSHPEFDKMLSRYLPANVLRNVQDIVENLRAKGIGDMPSETPSARHRPQASRSNSAYSTNESISTPGPSSRRSLLRTDEATVELVKEMTNSICANDWKERLRGIKTFLEMCENNPNVVTANIVKIFDKFLPRLQDSNSKVNLFALQVMLQIISLLKDSLITVINMAVANVAPNLSSKNKEIHSTAQDILHAFIDNIDSEKLIQPFANQAQQANIRSKPELVEKVAYLVARVYPRKQKQVILHVLPLLWSLLGTTMTTSGATSQGGGVNLRSSTAQLANSLYSCMGPTLLDKAAADPNVTPRHRRLLEDMLDSQRD